MRFPRWAGLPLLLFSVVSCNNAPTIEVPANSTSVDPAGDADQPDSDISKAELRLDIESWEQIQHWVAAQHGKIVVLDVWSNW